MRCEGIVDPLFFSLFNPAFQEEYLSQRKDIRSWLTSLSSCRRRATRVHSAQPLCFHSRKSKEDWEVGEWNWGVGKKEMRIFWWAKGVCGMDLNPFGFFPNEKMNSVLFFISVWLETEKEKKSWRFDFGFRSGILFGNVESHWKIIFYFFFLKKKGLLIVHVSGLCIISLGRDISS